MTKAAISHGAMIGQLQGTDDDRIVAGSGEQHPGFQHGPEVRRDIGYQAQCPPECPDPEHSFRAPCQCLAPQRVAMRGRSFGQTRAQRRHRPEHPCLFRGH